ncbi:serine/threonine-protein kinase [Hyalangium gracile]|uniref:serine/threonine-protein kinase n=1 Tax=Hyalangium gracile TaxID=394092 RepID=UPI001CCEA639|nr:serine/threonine-protein kinase [Hyalangium gracile]
MPDPADKAPVLEPTLVPELPASTEAAQPTLAGEQSSEGVSAPAPTEGPGEQFPVSQWSRYEFISLLGRGGMGEVYKARDRLLGRTVALKFIRGADPDLVMRFLQEARAQARIDHPHVCKVYEAGEVNGKAYIAMQVVGGERLDRAAASMSLPEKLQVMKDAALAMHEAHRLGVIHRDLKPSNILVERGEDGRCFPVIMDFGLAYEVSHGHGLTVTGALMGTPSYMAPEQARGELRSIDRRSDVYSLGATLYELLAGEAPFTDTTLVDTLNKVLHEEPPPLRSRVPQLESDLEIIVLKCLNKEPSQRYPSARALAEDLARFIDGEPILGRRPSLMYRLRRRARKHRALVGVSAASLATILVLSAFGVRSWLEARRTQQQSEERARLAEQLGQQVKEIEWFLRTTYALPLHDTSQEQQLVRERMAGISARQHELDAHGQGLVHHALGRGYLAMHEFENAHQELTRARERGIDSPELHYALGRVLGELFHQAMEETRRGGDAAWVAEQQRALEKQYLEPALQSLERSRGIDLESPRYLEGLIALYRREYDVAEQAAAEAIARAPWVYEARKLAGDVAYARAMERLERGEYDAARERLLEADRLYAQAVESGRSDAWNYEALSQVWLQQAEIDKRQGRSRKESVERALEAADKGIQAAALRSSSHTQKAYVLMHWYRVMNFERGGQEPKPILSQWLATASRAVELDARNAHAYDTLGYAWFMRGLQEAWERQDPSRSWDEATAMLTRALELEPDYLWGLNDLGLVQRWRGNYQREHGQDPTQAYAEAERHFRRAAASDPKYLFAHSNLVDLYNAMASYRLSRGLDPEAEVQKALEAGQQAFAIDKNLYSALNHVASAELTRARYLVDTQADPRPAIARAFQHLDQSLSINAKAGRTSFYRALGHLLLALHALKEERDPATALEAGRQALAESLRNDPRCADCRILHARLSLTEADQAKRQGRPVLPHLRQALAEAQQAVKMYPYYESHLELARAWWKLARALPPREAVNAVTEGLGQTQLALQLDPNLAHAHALRGALLLERARTERQTEARRDAARESKAALARAFELNPLLRWQYEDTAREAEAMGSPPG